MHDELPFLVLKVPLAQGSHVADPTPLYVPAGHGIQEIAPRLLYVPVQNADAKPGSHWGPEAVGKERDGKWTLN